MGIVFGEKDLFGIYQRGTGDTYSGRCTAPLLVMLSRRNRGSFEKQGSLLSNESDEIVELLNEIFLLTQQNHEESINLCPSMNLKERKEMKDYTYENISNAVYRSGFATSQQAYEVANNDLIAALDRIESILSTPSSPCSSDARKFLMGDHI